MTVAASSGVDPESVAGTSEGLTADASGLGRAVVAELSDTEREMMALLRAYIGGAIIETLADDLGLVVTQAGKHLRALEQRGLARCAQTRVLWGFGTVSAPVWSLSRSPECVAALMYLPWRDPPPQPPPDRVPPPYWSDFASGTHPGELRLPEDAVQVGGWLLDSGCVSARSWALTHLPVEALQKLRRMRGYTEGPIATSLDAAIRNRLHA